MNCGKPKPFPGVQGIPQETRHLGALLNGATVRGSNLPAWCRDLQVRIEVTVTPGAGAPVGDLILRTYREPTDPILAANLPDLQGESAVLTAGEITAAILGDRSASGATLAFGLDRFELFNQSGVLLDGVRVQLRVVPASSIPAQTQR